MTMTIRRGVSHYSFQQARFFGDMTLDDELAAVASFGATGVEIVDEMTLRYPDPGVAFVDHWHRRLADLGLTPVAMDVGMDVLQFRDHVMSHEECAERLRHDIRLARRLGFGIVRVLSVTPLEVMLRALPEAERQDIRLGREIHQPMTLEGPQAAEIIDWAEAQASDRLGIVPDLGIFQFRPSEAHLGWYRRKGAQEAACAAAIALSELIRSGEAGSIFDMSRHTAGNVRADYRRFLTTGEAPEGLAPAFRAVKDWADRHVPAPQEVDYVVVGEALTFSNARPETLRQIARHVTHVHGKFYEMSEIPGRPGEYHDASIDTEAAIGALKAGGFAGYVNSEYEGQRFYQDRTRAELQDEREQVRRHQQMLARLIG